MLQQNHSREAFLAKRRRERRRRRALTAATVAFAGVLAVGGTLAYIFTQSGEAENTFQPSSVSCVVNEMMDLDEMTKSDVSVANKGDVDAYVRAAVAVNWVDAAGNIVAGVPEGYSYMITNHDGSTATDISGLKPSNGWVKGPSDGFYYHTVAVSPEKATGELIEEISSSTPESPEYFLSVEIIASAIQADGKDSSGRWAVDAAWSTDAVKVDVDDEDNAIADGTLTVTPVAGN